MKARVVHCANAGRYAVAGMTVDRVQKGLREAFNIPGDADAIVNGKLVDSGHVLKANDHLEFSKQFGMKGGVQDFWSESEVVEIFGHKAVTEMKDLGFEPEPNSVFTKQQIAQWHEAQRQTSEIDSAVHAKAVVDFEQMQLRVQEGTFQIKDQLKFRVLQRLARRLNFAVHSDTLKATVWEDPEATEDETVNREVRRLGGWLKSNGISSLRTKTEKRRHWLLTS